MKTLALIELGRGQAESARGLLAKINIVYPEHPQVLSLLGVAYMEMGDHGLAQEYFARVVKLVPGSELGVINLARAASWPAGCRGGGFVTAQTAG